MRHMIINIQYNGSYKTAIRKEVDHSYYPFVLLHIYDGKVRVISLCCRRFRLSNITEKLSMHSGMIDENLEQRNSKFDAGSSEQSKFIS